MFDWYNVIKNPQFRKLWFRKDVFATLQNAKWSSKQKEVDALKAKNASLREKGK